MADYTSGYGTFESLEDFQQKAPVGNYWVSDEWNIYVNDFYFNESAQLWVGWFAEEFFEASDDNPQGYDDAEFALMSGDVAFDEFQVGPFVAVLNYDIYEDYNGAEGIFGVYVATEDYYETHLSDIYDVVGINARGRTYEDALEAGRDMFDGIKENNNLGITTLNLYDVLGQGDEKPIATRELANPESV